jgi:hypothetical protein
MTFTSDTSIQGKGVNGSISKREKQRGAFEKNGNYLTPLLKGFDNLSPVYI